MARPLEERLWSRVERGSGDECWSWLGSQNSRGYGQIMAHGHMTGVHRVAYELAVGPIPEGLQIDHLCRNPLCVNPAHLEPVTQRENMLRGVSPGARAVRDNVCKRGHPFDLLNTYVDPKGWRRCRECHRLDEIRRRRAGLSR